MGVGSVVANHRCGGESLVVVTTLLDNIARYFKWRLQLKEN